MIVRSYEDWLTLSHDAKCDLLTRWNVYEHEMFWVPMMAASRLAASTEHVTDIYVGIYHGGTYVLHLSVPADLLPRFPGPLEQEFEGFPVIWIQSSHYVRPASDELFGIWESSGILGDFEISITSVDGRPKISVHRAGSTAELEVLDPRFDGRVAEFYTRAPNEVAIFHRLSVPESDNCCNHNVSLGQIARKRKKSG